MEKIRVYLKQETDHLMMQVHEPGFAVIYKYELDRATRAVRFLRKLISDAFMPLKEGEQEETIARHVAFDFFRRAKLGDNYLKTKNYPYYADSKSAWAEELRPADNVRLAFRVEGEWWNCYITNMKNMDGALKVGAINFRIASGSSDVKETFMRTMQLALVALGAIDDFTISRGPEHERPGNA